MGGLSNWEGGGGGEAYFEPGWDKTSNFHTSGWIPACVVLFAGAGQLEVLLHW